MSLTHQKKRKSEVPPLAADTYIATIVAVIDLGEQFKKYEKEKQGKYVDELLFLFEVSGEMVDIDGEQKPRWLSKSFTNSMHEKSTLYAVASSLLKREFTEDEKGGNFDVTQMLGSVCSVEVKISKDGEYNNIQTVTGVPKGFTVSPTMSELLLFDIDNRDEEVFAKLPEWIQERIRKSTQYQQDLPQKQDSPEEPETQDAAAMPDEKPKGACPI